MRTLVGLSGTPLNGPKPVMTKQHHGHDTRDEPTMWGALLSVVVVFGYVFDTLWSSKPLTMPVNGILSSISSSDKLTLDKQRWID